jgi:hypothetical protein
MPTAAQPRSVVKLAQYTCVGMRLPVELHVHNAEEQSQIIKPDTVCGTCNVFEDMEELEDMSR